MENSPNYSFKNQRSLSAQKDLPESNTIPVNIALSLRCIIHKDEYCDSIDLSLSTPNPRICARCQYDFSISPTKTLTVRQLLNQSSDSFFHTFPILEDMQLIKEVQAIVGSTDEIINQFEEFFKYLRAAIDLDFQKINQIQKLKLDRLSNQYLKTLETFQSISKKNEFKEALLRNANNPGSNQLKEFIQMHIENAKMNTVLIKQELQNFHKIKSNFSTEAATQILQRIRDSFGEIDFFQGLDYPNIRNNEEEEIRALQNTIQMQNSQIKNLKKQLAEEQRQKEVESSEKKKLQLILEEMKLQNQVQQKLDLPQNDLKELKQQPKQSILQNTNINSDQELAPQDLNESSLLKQIQCLVQTHLSDSQTQMKIDVLDNGQITMSSTEPTKWVGCYLRDPLLKNEKYIFRIKLNNNNNTKPNLCFGLIEGNNKSSASLETFHMFYNEFDGFENIIPVRGGQLYSQVGSRRIGEKMLEFRIDLSQRYFRISDLPNYSKVAKLKITQNIKDQEEYHVAFQILGSTNSINLMEVISVKEFDEKM